MKELIRLGDFRTRSFRSLFAIDQHDFVRLPERVASDVRRGYYTVTQVRELYGVVLDAETLAVDARATEAERASRAKQAAE